MENYSFDLGRILIGDLPALYILEIVLRTVLLYGYTLFLLRLTGRRSVGKLTPLQLVLVLTLGAAAGDPMFYPKVPVLHGATVITVVVIIQRLLVYITARNMRAEALIKGVPMRLVKDGKMDLEGYDSANLSREEIFMELRHSGVGHLGQVERTYIEPDGKISIYRYDQGKVRPGLPISPPWDLQRPEAWQAGSEVPETAHYACMKCGETDFLADSESFPLCPRCENDEWTQAKQGA